jgi:hypothetical protein
VIKKYIFFKDDKKILTNKKVVILLKIWIFRLLWKISIFQLPCFEKYRYILKNIEMMKCIYISNAPLKNIIFVSPITCVLFFGGVKIYRKNFYIFWQKKNNFL